jgi:hypothetical protein
MGPLRNRKLWHMHYRHLTVVVVCCYVKLATTGCHVLHCLQGHMRELAYKMLAGLPNWSVTVAEATWQEHFAGHLDEVNGGVHVGSAGAPAPWQRAHVPSRI